MFFSKKRLIEEFTYQKNIGRTVFTIVESNISSQTKYGENAIQENPNNIKKVMCYDKSTGNIFSKNALLIAAIKLLLSTLR